MQFAEVAHTEDEIKARVAELALEIEAEAIGERPLLVSVLKGSVIFLSDLVKQMSSDPVVDFMSISSYPGESKRTGVVRIVKDLEEPLEGRHVVVVEDIVDTGLTLAYLLGTLRAREPRSLKVCAFVNKPTNRIPVVDVDYQGFEAENFLIGYGLDFHGRYRNLPFLAAVTDLAALAADPRALDGAFAPSN